MDIVRSALRMPAEWSPHQCTVMSWPVNRNIWGAAFEQAKEEYAAVARSIARFEPVLMVANPGDEGDASARCGKAVEVVPIPIDDSWMRDSGPIVVSDAEDRRVGITFRFDAYGGRFPCAKDAEVSARVLEHLGIAARRSEMILEGGSINVDGEGTLITTEQCLLEANRNPGWTRERIEEELRAQFGVDKIVWLRWGRLEDAHTDGHVDVVAMFVRPGVVLAQGWDDRSDPNYDRLQDNLRTLRSTTDARGRALEVIEAPLLPPAVLDGAQVMVSNVNAYFVNGGLIVPIAGGPRDGEALDVFRRACPDREVVGIPSSAIWRGGGGIHCITQQVPAHA